MEAILSNSTGKLFWFEITKATLRAANSSLLSLLSGGVACGCVVIECTGSWTAGKMTRDVDDD